jgi:ABC-type antimicrobial peptide transport system permease subunit
VAIVNDTLASLFWPDGEAVGKRLREPNGRTFDDVGVVKPPNTSAGEEPTPFVYFPLDQGNAQLTFFVRTRISSRAALHTLREELRALDPAVTVFDIETMKEHLADSLLPVRVGAILLGIFGGLALGLASIGLYGLLAYLVCRRTHEIGVRMALGANRPDVLNVILKHGMRLTVLGIGIGLVFGFGLSILIASQLYGVRLVATWSHLVA